MSNSRRGFPTKAQGRDGGGRLCHTQTPTCHPAGERRAACMLPSLAGESPRSSVSNADRAFYTVLTLWSSSSCSWSSHTPRSRSGAQGLHVRDRRTSQTNRQQQKIHLHSLQHHTHPIRPSIINILAYDVPFTPGSQSTLQCVGIDFYFAGVNRVEKD